MGPLPHDLAQAWQLALEHWNQPPRHDTLLGLAAKHQQFVWLAGKYRDAARSNPADAIAQDRIARVRRAAAIVMMTKAAPPEPMPKAYRSVSILLIGAVLAMGLGLYITESKLQQHHAIVSRHP